MAGHVIQANGLTRPGQAHHRPHEIARQHRPRRLVEARVGEQFREASQAGRGDGAQWMATERRRDEEQLLSPFADAHRAAEGNAPFGERGARRADRSLNAVMAVVGEADAGKAAGRDRRDGSEGESSDAS